jgi:acyl carrier protein
MQRKIVSNSVRQSVIEAITTLLEEDELSVPALEDDTVLLETGLDSLGFAVLVTRLEESLGYDPFTLMTEAVYPRTLNDFVTIYETYAP